MHNIVIFGDSIALGRGVSKIKSWSSLLTQDFDKKDTNSILVYNLSIPGQSSNEILKRFPVEIEARCKNSCAEDQHTIIFAMGINDAKCIGVKNTPATSVKTFENNIRSLISSARSYTDHIIFIGPTLVNEKKTTPIDNNYFYNKKILMYSGIIKDICRGNKVFFVDIANDWSLKDYKKFLASDGIHPNVRGHNTIYQKIAGVIENFNPKENLFDPFQILKREYSLSSGDITAIKKRFIGNKIIKHEFFFGQFNSDKPELIIGAPCIRKDINGFCLNTFSQIFVPIKVASILNLPCKLFIGVKEEIIFQPKMARLYEKLGYQLEQAARNIAEEFAVKLETVNTTHLGHDKLINRCVKELNIRLSSEDSTYLFNLSTTRPKKQLHSRLRVFSSERVVACNTSYALNKLFGSHNNLIVADIEQHVCAWFARKFEKKYKHPNFLSFLPLPNTLGTSNMFKAEKEARFLLQKDDKYYESIFKHSPPWVVDSYWKLFELTIKKGEFKNKEDVNTFIAITKNISNYFPKLDDVPNSKK